MILLTLAGCLAEYEPGTAAVLVPEGHPCAEVTPGPWSGHSLSGADITTAAYTHDAGIQRLFDLEPPEGQTATLDVTITGAIVVNVGFGEGNQDPPLWLADSAGGVRTFDVPGLGDVRPGDEVTFRVNEVTNYFGELEITSLSGLEVTSSDHPIQVVSVGERSLNFPGERGLNVEFAGLVTGDSGEECGDNPCLVLDNGVVTHTIDLRGPFPSPIEPDQTCLHVLAPVEFTRGAARIGASDFDWIQAY